MFQKNHTFKYYFEVFDYDDGFLSKVDIDVKNAKENHFKKTHDNEQSSLQSKMSSAQKKYEKKVSENCSSPVLFKLSAIDFHGSLSSTPTKQVDSLETSQKKEIVCTKENDFQNDYDFWEADLFEDWNTEDILKSQQKEKGSVVTLSQALNLVEKEKPIDSIEKLDEKSTSNESINLFTGEVIHKKPEKAEDLFEDSFDINNINSVEKKIEKDLLESKCNSTSGKFVKSNSVKCKPLAAHKLNFETKEPDLDCAEIKIIDESVNFEDFSFGDNESLVFDQICLEDDINKDKLDVSIPTHYTQSIWNAKISNSERVECEEEKQINNTCDLSDGSINLCKRRAKCFKVIESDESPSPKFLRQKKKIEKYNVDSKNSLGRQFIDSEAELSGECKVSSDEVEMLENDEYDSSFVDEESYFTQNYEADMTAEYLKSTKTMNNPGPFKIPEAKPFDPDEIFSQMPTETNSDYEIDSFCVEEVEESDRDLHDLEVAELILEMNRKRRKNRAGLNSRKVVRR